MKTLKPLTLSLIGLLACSASFASSTDTYGQVTLNCQFNDRITPDEYSNIQKTLESYAVPLYNKGVATNDSADSATGSVQSPVTIKSLFSGNQTLHCKNSADENISECSNNDSSKTITYNNQSLEVSNDGYAEYIAKHLGIRIYASQDATSSSENDTGHYQAQLNNDVYVYMKGMENSYDNKTKFVSVLDLVNPSNTSASGLNGTKNDKWNAVQYRPLLLKDGGAIIAGYTYLNTSDNKSQYVWMGYYNTSPGNPNAGQLGAICVEASDGMAFA